MSLIRSDSDERLAEQGMLTLTDEKLERAFREIEEASERRAQEEANREELVQDTDGHPAELPSSNGMNGSSPTPTTTVAAARKRHRGSISISRVGTLPDLSSAVEGTASPVQWKAPTPAPVPTSSNPMYKVQTGAASVSTIASTSTMSSFSRSHGGGSHFHDEELNHTTQKQTIIGRRNTLTRVGAHFAGAVQVVSNLADVVSERVSAIGKAGNGVAGVNEPRRGRPRAMTRTRSKQALREAVEFDAMVSREDPVVIGVRVQEKTTEEETARSAQDQRQTEGAGASSSKPTVATVIHASKSESEIGQQGDRPSSSSGKKKNRPRAATGSGDALPPPPPSFATVSAGSTGIMQLTSTTVVVSSANADDNAEASVKQERRKSQTLGPTTGGNRFGKNTNKRLSILRTGFTASPSSPPTSGSAPLSPSSPTPIRSPRRSPAPSPSRSPSFPSLTPSISPSSSSAFPSNPPTREQTTTKIEVGKSAGLDPATDAKAGRPPLKRSFTHYARVLAKKLKRRTVSDGPGSGKGESVSSTSSAPTGIPGVTTSTVVVEEVKQVDDADGQAGENDASVEPEASVYPRDVQEIEIRVESEEDDTRNVETARAVPLPPSPSPVLAKTFEDVGGPPLMANGSEGENFKAQEKVEDEGEVVDSAIDVPASMRLGERILNFDVPYKDNFVDERTALQIIPAGPRLSVSPHPTITKDEPTSVPHSPEPSNAPFLPEFGLQEDQDDEHEDEQEQESELEEGPSFDGTVDEPKEDSLDESTRKSEDVKAEPQPRQMLPLSAPAENEKATDLSTISVAVVAPSS